MKRDFASLTPQEALHVAIFIEERNAEIYHQFAEMFSEFHDPESLEIAVTAEQGALRYYTPLSEITEDADLKALYREFVDFESGHTDWLQKKMADARRTSGGTKLA